MINKRDQIFLNRKNIVEICHTFQGEGKFIGKPMYLIRFDGCNLACPFCDTMLNHQHRPEKLYQPKRSVNECIDYIIKDFVKRDNASSINLMFTGGEPTLYNKEMRTILDTLLEFDFSIFEKVVRLMNISIESNGCKLEDFIYYLYSIGSNIRGVLDQDLRFDINFSPKYMIDYEKDTFFSFLDWCLSMTHSTQMSMFIKKNVNIKLVYDPSLHAAFEKNILEPLEYFTKEDSNESSNRDVFYLPDITLMPIGTTVSDLDENMKYVVDVAKKYDFNITTRMHIIHSDSILK
jgi:organic radical activating enzyme